MIMVKSRDPIAAGVREIDSEVDSTLAIPCFGSAYLRSQFKAVEM